jgi:MarR family transcriptional regulator, lower aerobic nicotinate degradation pathway regulator
MAIKTREISGREDHLGYWLRYVSNHVSNAFRRKVEAKGVTVAEWVVMRELYAGSLAPSVVAERIGMTRGAISKLADRLKEKAMLTRASGKGDGRYQELALTPAGRALVPQLAALADQNDAEFFGHLSREERATIERLMQEIVRKSALRAVPID